MVDLSPRAAAEQYTGSNAAATAAAMGWTLVSDDGQSMVVQMQGDATTAVPLTQGQWLVWTGGAGGVGAAEVHDSLTDLRKRYREVTVTATSSREASR